MLGIVQSLDRVRKIGVDEVDQRRAAIKEHGERIKRDIQAWKKMKQDFEAERNVLAQIRETIETLLATKRKNLDLNQHAAHRLFGTGQDAIESHANVVAALQNHNKLISRVCQAEDDFSASATGSAGGGLTQSTECMSCLARQTKGENIACDMCVDNVDSTPQGFTMDDDEISATGSEISATGSSEDLDCETCLQRQQSGENIACGMCPKKRKIATRV